METSSAGEQLVRDNTDARRKCQNQRTVLYSPLIFLESFIPLKTHQ